MTFDQHVIRFLLGLPQDLHLPKGVELIYPFDLEEVKDSVKSFYNKYYNDKSERYFLFGINPGRLGAGMTGIPFTDPVYLKDVCGIDHSLPLKHELSSIFIYDMINALGGADQFYQKFFISSVCPLGFLKDNKNYNYYDDKKLFNALEGFIVESMEKQISQYCNRSKVYSLGKGKNFQVLSQLNDQYRWFDEVIALPHPRWVMQYKRKYKAEIIERYAKLLNT